MLSIDDFSIEGGIYRGAWTLDIKRKHHRRDG